VLKLSSTLASITWNVDARFLKVLEFYFQKEQQPVCRSVLESADQALRQKPRQPSACVSSIVKSPPLKSSVQKIAVESTQPVAAGDVRTVVHGKMKDSSRHEKRHHRHHSSSSRTQASNHAAPRATEQLLITVTEEDRATATSSDEQRLRSAAPCDERKVSIMDEDQFEPDYDESETAADAEHHPGKESTSGDGKRLHSRRKRSRHASESTSKSSKKHKKHHKKSKRHKSSRKSDK